MFEQRYAIIMVRESRAKDTGVKVENEFIVVTAAADDKRSYGCEILINMDIVMVKWGNTKEKKTPNRNRKMSPYYWPNLHMF